MKYVKHFFNTGWKFMQVSPELFEILVHPSPIVWEEASQEEFDHKDDIGAVGTNGTGEPV